MSELGKKMCFCCENTYEKLFSLESVLRITKDACMEKENSSSYYGLSPKHTYILSRERNDFMNILDLALDKLDELKSINNMVETEIQPYIL